MRMRKKKNLDSRLERQSAITVSSPSDKAGHWRELMPDASGLSLEIGCGKGRFTTQLAAANPDRLYIAVERERGAIVMAMEKVARAGLKNVYFVIGEAAAVADWFASGEVDELYINFCDPWTGNHRAKRRLTHHNFLNLYRQILSEGATLKFKTDNPDLFKFSVMELPAWGMELLTVTHDLHSTDIPNIMTEYEERFSSQGIKINYLEARFIPGWTPPEQEQQPQDTEG